MKQPDNRFDINTHAPTNPGATRRDFLKWMGVAVNGVIGLLLAVPLVGYALSPLLKRVDALWVRLGPLASFDNPGHPKRVRFDYIDSSGYTKIKTKGMAWVVAGESVPTVFSPACTHKGCNFDWNDKKHRFLCPCHGGQFAATGEVLGGPPPRPLDRYETRVKGLDLFVRIDRVRRTG